MSTPWSVEVHYPRVLGVKYQFIKIIIMQQYCFTWKKTIGPHSQRMSVTEPSIVFAAMKQFHLLQFILYNIRSYISRDKHLGFYISRYSEKDRGIDRIKELMVLSRDSSGDKARTDEGAQYQVKNPGALATWRRGLGWSAGITHNIVREKSPYICVYSNIQISIIYQIFYIYHTYIYKHTNRHTHTNNNIHAHNLCLCLCMQLCSSITLKGVWVCVGVKIPPVMPSSPVAGLG